MARNESVDIHIRAQDSASQVMSRFNRNLRNTAAGVGSLRGALSGLQPFLVGGLALGGTALAIGGISSGIGEAIRRADQFQAATSAMARVTERDLAAVRQEIMDLPAALGDRTRLMEGYYQVMSAGITEPARALDTLAVASKDAQALGIEQGEVVKALTKFMQGYTGEIENATEASDLLYRMERLGQTQFSELVPEIGSAAAISKELAVSQYELGGSIAQISLTAGSTSQAFTQYRAIVNSLLKPSERLTELLAGMGYASGQALVEERGFIGALQALEAAAAASGHQLGYFFESSEALVGIAAIAANEYQDVTQRVVEMGEAGNETASAFDEWRQDFGGIKGEWDATVGKMLIQFGEKLLPVAMQGMKDLTAWFQDHDGQIQAYFDKAATAVGFFAERLADVLGLLGAIAEILNKDMNVIEGMHMAVGDGAGIAVQVRALEDKLAELQEDRAGMSNLTMGGLLAGPDGEWAETTAAMDAAISEIQSRINVLRESYQRMNTSGAHGGGYEDRWTPTEEQLAAMNQQRGLWTDWAGDAGNETGNEFADAFGDAATNKASEGAQNYFDMWADAGRERARVLADFEMEYTRAVEGDFAAERLELDRQRDHFAEVVRDQTALRIWYAQESAAIAEREAEAQKNAMQDVADAQEEQTERMVSAIQGFGDLGMDVFDALRGSAELTFEDIANMAMQALDLVGQFSGYSGGTDMLGSLLGGLFGSLGGGSASGSVLGGLANASAFVLHGGGIAGDSSVPRRSVHPGVFAGAPRMHTGGFAGLRRGEVPAILQAGEPVLPKGTRLGGMSVSITMNNDFSYASAEAIADIRRQLAEMKRVMPGQVAETLARNPGMRRLAMTGR